MKLFVPITKVDVEKRLVYGVAADETPDRSGEIFDYATSKAYFEEWSGEIAKATDGKSLGNVRSMHTSVAAGKVTQLVLDDEAKAIPICAKVVDDNEWKKVEEGVYTGFSVGGKYVKRWRDPDDATKTRYTAKPIEISLVDLPCNPGASFEVIKADGLTEQRQFKHKEEIPLEVNKTILAEFQKAFASNDLAKAFSFEEIRDSVRSAIREQISTPFNCGYFWIAQTYPDHVIVEGDLDGDGDSDMYQINYTMDDAGEITLDVASAVEVRVSYVPIAAEPAPAEKSTVVDDLQKGSGTGESDQGKIDPPATDPLTPTEKSADPDDLAKAGAKHSKETVSQLQKMAHDLNAMGGACQCDGCKKMYGSAAKAVGADDLAKGELGNTLAKAVDGLAALQKAFDGLQKENETLVAKFAVFEKQPLPGGPVLNGSVALNKSLGGEGGAQPDNSQVSELALLKKMRDEATDGVMKQAFSEKIAMLEIRQLHKATSI